MVGVLPDSNCERVWKPPVYIVYILQATVESFRSFVTDAKNKLGKENARFTWLEALPVTEGHNAGQNTVI